MGDWVLVPCTGRRTEELVRLLDDLRHPKERVCVVTTDPDPVRREDIAGAAGHLIRLGDEVNYGKWLNAGMDYIRADCDSRYVFITGSDTRGNTSTVSALVEGAMSNGFVMCGPDHWHLGTLVFDPQKVRGIFYRVPPEYFLLDLRSGLRFDEQFRWWYSDDDLEMQARRSGRIGLVAGVYAEQPGGAHELTKVTARWATEDRIKFIEKWGHEPW